MARLFEQGEVTTPDTTEKLASGKSGSPTSNITIANFVAWLNTVLGFLKISSNLADGDAPTMRTNLDVYSTTEIDDELALKADSDNVLEKDNTTAFTPTADFHPATKKYVDSAGGEVVYSAYCYEVDDGTVDPSSNIHERINSSFISQFGKNIEDQYIFTLASSITESTFEEAYMIFITAYGASTAESRTYKYYWVDSTHFWVDFEADTPMRFQIEIKKYN